jgi:DNA-binding transcriptional MerR regulator
MSQKERDILRRVANVKDDALTIDELARRVGMTARNVRAHQTRGLIPPPRLEGRTGYYGPVHVARLERIRELQDQGFNLEAIRRLLAAGDSPEEALDFMRALAAPFGDEQPQVVDTATLFERWGEQVTTEQLQRLVSLGFLRRLEDGRYEIRSPRLDRAARELAELGVPFEVAVNVVATLREHSEAVASAFVELFLENVWRPFEARGEPNEEWPRVRETLERLRPLAGESLLAVFGIVMTDAVERAFQSEADRAGPDAA